MIAAVLATVLLSGCAYQENPSASADTSYDSEATETSDAESGKVEPSVISDAESAESSETGSAETDMELPKVELHDPDSELFTEMLNKVYTDYGITGMSVALFCNGEIIHTENIGYSDTYTMTPCTDNTRYRTCSVSKLISTMVLMTLCDEGMIDPYSDLTEVTGIQYDGDNTEKIKLWHLLTHTSGIIDNDRYYDAPKERYNIDYILSTAHTKCEPGTTYIYSNFGAGTIGSIVERLTGEFFHDYADEVLFEPLGMDAGYIIDLIDDKASCATLYGHDGSIYHVPTWGRNRIYYESFGLGNSYLTAQCELLITASDLARLGIVLAGDGTVDGKQVLSKESVDLINSPYFSCDDFDMGLNVRIYDDLIEGRIIYGHPGNALGVIAGLYYDRNDGTGVAFLTNHCLTYTYQNGVYKAIKDTLDAAYQCYLR